MFNKSRASNTEHKGTGSVADNSESIASSPASSGRPSSSIIGSHTQVEGDINSGEDLTVKGRVSGIITCKQHTVTLGAGGYINGDVFASTLHVSGEVEGNLIALHRTIVHKGAQVTGTIISPCVVLEDGSLFYGNIDMNPEHEMLTKSFKGVAAASFDTNDEQATASLTASHAKPSSTQKAPPVKEASNAKQA